MIAVGTCQKKLQTTTQELSVSIFWEYASSLNILHWEDHFCYVHWLTQPMDKNRKRSLTFEKKFCNFWGMEFRHSQKVIFSVIQEVCLCNFKCRQQMCICVLLKTLCITNTIFFSPWNPEFVPMLVKVNCFFWGGRIYCT